jgi:signal transduction histidine kinase/ligand-binding sensor domain-containing protein
MNLHLQQKLWRVLGFTALLWASLPHALCFPAKPNLQFSRISKEKGLSNDSVRAMYQDRKGFLWLGTQDGLNRFDGTQYDVFRHHQEDPNSLSDNHILAITQDREDFLWIGTNSGGVNRLDPRTEKIDRYRHRESDPRSLSSDRVTAILQDQKGQVWIGTDDGLNLWDQDSGFIKFLPLGQADALPHARVECLFEDQSGALWIGTQRGLARMKPDHSGFEIWQAEARIDGLRNDFILSINQDQAGRLWIGTSNGLFHMLEENKFKRYSAARVQDDIHPDPVNEIWPTPEGTLWLGTHGGLGIFDPSTNKLHLYRHDSSNQQTIPGDRINSIVHDHSGLVWLSTDSNGICYFNPDTLRFQSIGYGNSKTTESIGDPRTISLYEDLEGMVWIGTLIGGLKRYDPITDTIKIYDFTGLADGGTISGTVRSIAEGPNGLLWLGVAGSGLMSFDRRTETFTRFQHIPGDETTIAHDDIRALWVNSEGHLWVGNQEAIDLFDVRQKRVTRSFPRRDERGFIHQGYLAKIYEDDKDNLWLAVMARGLFKVDLSNDQVTRIIHDPDDPYSLSHQSATDMYTDSKGRFWIGTQGGGINLVLSDTDSTEDMRFKAYTRLDGLAADAIGGILEDGEGNLWVSTTTGISRFDPEAEQFTNFSTKDGLPPHSYIIGAYNKGFSGKLYFGGWQGTTFFDPSIFRDVKPAPETLLTGFRLFNLEVRPRWQDPDSPLLQTISYTQQVDLQHRQSAFSIAFSALDFANADDQRYSYQLQGWDDRWIETNARQPFATYTNLDAGSYVFRVRAANQRGEWHEHPTELEIVISSPPWASWWAYTLYIAIVGGLIAAYVNGQKRKLAYKARIIRRLRDLDKIKDQFLANTSHELRTPLNGIIGLTESLIDGAAGPTTPEMVENLEMVVASAKRLSHLVNDVLDFSKLRHDQLTMQAAIIDLRLVAETTLRLSQPLIADKRVRFINDIPANLKVMADENRLQQIFHNLVGNAIKFTETGSVRLSAKNLGEMVEICVQDTGIGISENHQRRIFESFEQADGSTARIYGGAGLGLAITKELVQRHGGRLWVTSTPGEGSEFYFSIPSISNEAAQKLEYSLQDHLDEPHLQEVLKPAQETGPLDDFDALPTQKFMKPEFWILIVDDDPVNRRVLVNHLSLVNYAVIEAEDGEEALEIVNRRYPVIDLVILDVMMPRLTGYETCFKLRESFPMQELPILILTARNNDNDIVRAFSSGANDFLNKPVSKSELLSRVSTHLQLKDINRNLEEKVSERTQELRETHDQLMEAAHRAGMAEVAINVLHNLGNALNSSRTSLASIKKHSDPARIQKFLGSIKSLVEQNREALAAIPEYGGRLEKLPIGIETVIEELEKKSQKLLAEIEGLEQGTEQMVDLVLAQRQYAESEALYASVNLIELLDMVVANQEPHFQAHNIKIRFKSDLSKARGKIQKTKFIAVLIHLLNNAAEALSKAPEAEYEVNLSLAYTMTKEFELHIHDNGPGVPEHLKSRIFEQGFSTKDGSAGFGLHFCVNAMREMGGNLLLLDQEKGAHFVLKIPKEYVLEVDFTR